MPDPKDMRLLIDMGDTKIVRKEALIEDDSMGVRVEYDDGTILVIRCGSDSVFRIESPNRVLVQDPATGRVSVLQKH